MGFRSQIAGLYHSPPSRLVETVVIGVLFAALALDHATTAVALVNPTEYEANPRVVQLLAVGGQPLWILVDLMLTGVTLFAYFKLRKYPGSLLIPLLSAAVRTFVVVQNLFLLQV